MWPYFFLVGTPAIVLLLGNRNNRERLNRTAIDSFFVIWLILLVFRHESIGADLVGYEWYFSLSSDMGLKDLLTADMEAGFLLLSKLLQFIGLGFRSAIISVALLSLVPIWRFYRENCKNNVFLSIVVFLSIGLFGIYFSALRQVIAMGFAVPIYRYTKDKRVLPVIFLVLCAMLFHRSAVVMLLFYPVYHLRIQNIQRLLLLMMLVLPVYLLRVPIFLLAQNLLFKEYTLTLSETGAFATLLLFLVFLIYSFTITNNSVLDADTYGLRNLLILSIFIQIFSGINTLVMRLNYYFILFIPILVPRLFRYANEKNMGIARVSVFAMVSFFTVYYFYRAYSSTDYLNIYPYLAFWQ